jgi:hypothetical protein
MLSPPGKVTRQLQADWMGSGSSPSEPSSTERRRPQQRQMGLGLAASAGLGLAASDGSGPICVHDQDMPIRTFIFTEQITAL